MKAWLSLPVGEFLAAAPQDVAARLAHAQASRHATLELAQRHAWEAEARILRDADARWRIRFECDLLRPEERADAVLLTDRTILAMEFKHGGRYETAIGVPRGSDAGQPFHDATRDAREMDAIAGFLLACGARPLGEATAAPARAESAMLL